MYTGDVGGVSGGNNIQWNKKLAEELDSADGKKDGKISASVWNDFMNKTGSSGNKIKNFINLNNAEKSFNYYDKKKDSGKVDWSNWQELLNDFKKDKGLPVDDTVVEPKTEPKTEPETEPTVDPKIAPKTEPKVEPKTEPKTEPKVEPKPEQTVAEELQTAMKDSPMVNVKTPQDIKNLDKSKFTLVADCGPNETRMINPETGESLVGKEDVAAGKGTITYSNGAVSHTINYELGDSGKLLSGEVSVKQPDGAVKNYKYTYDANGNVVPEEPEEPKVDPNKDKRTGLTDEQKAEFVKNSPINTVQNAADVDKLEMSGYKKILFNYQGSEFFENKQTGEQISVERSFGTGGYKTLGITYTKDGVTQEIKFDKETEKITSNEVRAAKPEDSVNVPVFPKIKPKINPEAISHGPDFPSQPESQVTKLNNKVSHFKDENGYTVIRVDYNNNNQDSYDEEEVRTPDGKLISYTEVSRDTNKEVQSFKKRIFDDKGNLVKVIETKYEKGQLKETKELPVEDEPDLTGIVHIGVPVDGTSGDPELKKIVHELGGGIIGNN